MDTKYKIVQLLPVTDVWIRFKEDTGEDYYDKAIALALIEYHMPSIGLCQGLTYLCRAEVETLEVGGIQQTQDIFFEWELPEELKRDLGGVRKGSCGV